MSGTDVFFDDDSLLLEDDDSLSYSLWRCRLFSFLDFGMVSKKVKIPRDQQFFDIDD